MTGSGVTGAAGRGTVTRRGLLARAAGATSSDERVLAELLAAELAAVTVARQTLSAGHLPRRAAELVARVRADDTAHAAALGTALAALAGSPAAARAHEARAKRQAPIVLRRARLADPPPRSADPGPRLARLADTSELLIGAWRGALAHLRVPAHVTLAGQVLGSEAQHLSALRLLGGRPRIALAVPDAFVAGRRFDPPDGW